ncbi:hypothetical protein [Bacillus sp. Marseille-Q3570]|uniref:hypothetical protein n=1 Tax=Bacillus sp. Marseille-Q3570 TaxID=2963522 RepID=UPI0021B7402A|nr:hypothetical protein [Bacillus sp. Marseille-Q3570]
MRDPSKLKIAFSSCHVTLLKLTLSYGISWTGETIQCRNGTSGLAARLPESEHPGAEINDF